MKCPKCGNEYEGDKCLYCGGLDIIVNSSDYEKRKKAYEEQKQGASGDENPEPPKKKKVKKVKNGKNKPEKEENDKKNKPDSQSEPTERQKRRRVFIGVGVGVVLVAGIVFIGILSVKNMASIYFKIGTDIYKDDYVYEAHQTGKDDEIWNADTSRLFSVVVPANISGLSIKDKMASMNGDYFSVITYDSILNYYTIWMWNSKGDVVERMLTTSNQLELVYVGDDGSVIYKNNEMVGEGTLVGSSLNMVDRQKAVFTIGENVVREFIYLRDKSIVYLSSDGNLYLSYFNDVRESVLIASDVNAVMSEVKNCSDRYSENAMSVHDSYLKPQIIYVSDGTAYYVNLSGQKRGKLLFETEKTGIDVVYQEKSDYAYCISRLSIDGITISGGSYEVASLAKLKTGSEAVYLSKAEAIVYLTESGKLVSIKYKNDNFSKKLLESELIVNGKTSGIYLPDGDEGLLIFNDGKPYFYRNIDEEPILLKEYDGGEIKFFSYYGRKLYIVDDKKMMYIFDGKGKLEDTVKDTEFIWIG